jgi:hypothetical protein
LPAGRNDFVAREETMARFVILEHDHPHPHYDLMLQAGDVLWTWRLPQLPRVGDVLDAVRIADHRLAYLEYEGPISGNRGTVIRCEQGTIVWLKEDIDDFEVGLNGMGLRARLRLKRDATGESWRIECVG